MSDIDEVTVVYKDTFSPEWCTKSPKQDWVQNELNSPELPPNGLKTNHKFQAIRFKETNEVIGYFTTYYGFITDDSAWIADLFFLQKYTHQGFGQELITQYFEEVRSLNHFNIIGCTVNLMNWPGIRFWSKLGFTKITDYFGDKDYSPQNDGNLCLECDISKENYPQVVVDNFAIPHPPLN